MTHDKQKLEDFKQHICAKWNLKNYKDTRRVRNQLHDIAFDETTLDPHVIMQATSLNELQKLAQSMLDAQTDLQTLIDLTNTVINI